MTVDSHFKFHFVSAAEVIALGVALPLVCAAAVALRFFTRHVQRAGLKADDWLALGALLPMVGMGACLITGARMKVMGYSVPAPPMNLSEEQISYWEHAEKLKDTIQYTFLVLLMIAYGLTKTAILFLYRRIFVIQKKSVVYVLVVATVIIVALWAFVFGLLMIIACGQHFWAIVSSTGLKYAPARLQTQNALVISDLILDVFIYFIPIPLVWRLQMSLRRKLAVIGVFLIGASSVGASIARLIIGVEVVQADSAGEAVDELQAATLADYWCLLEAGLALIASCLPPMAYLVTHRREIRFWSSGSAVRNLSFLRRSEASQGQSEVNLKGIHHSAKPVTSIARTVSIDVASEHRYCTSADHTCQIVPSWYPDGA